MQPETKGPLKPIQTSLSSSRDKNNDQELSLQLLDNTTQEILNERDFLSEQLSRCSYKLYKFWLALTFIIGLLVELDSISYLIWIFGNIRNYDTLSRLAIATMANIISFIFLLLGCGQIFFAITKKRSSIAQKSVLKFQYSMIAALFASMLRTRVPDFKFNLALFTSTGFIAWPLLIITHLVFNFAILKVFKQNNPLARQRNSSKNLEDLSNTVESDFWKQNEAISLEVWKYDQRLNSCAYIIYKLWLRLAVVLETLLFSGVIIVKIINVVKGVVREKDELEELGVLSLAQSVFYSLTFGLTAYCCYEMEVVLRTKTLQRSKKGLVHLRMCIFVAIITSLLTFIQLDFEKYFWVNSTICFFGFILAPLMTFLGAVCANGIIEQRDQFVKVSSYNEDCYV